MIPMQYALRRRMMMQERIPKWTLSVTGSNMAATVSINGVKLENGVYTVDDGTIVHFWADGYMAQIKVNGKNVASGAIGIPAQYDLELHSNCTAIGSTGASGIVGTWKITIQQ